MPAALSLTMSRELFACRIASVRRAIGMQDGRICSYSFPVSMRATNYCVTGPKAAKITKSPRATYLSPRGRAVYEMASKAPLANTIITIES